MEPIREELYRLGDELLKTLTGKETKELLNSVSGTTESYDLCDVTVALTNNGLCIHTGGTAAARVMGKMAPRQFEALNAALTAAARSPQLRAVASAANDLVDAAYDKIEEGKGNG